MWLSDFFAERRGLVCRSSVRACLPYIPNASEPITLFSQRIWCGAQHFQRHLWEFVAFFGLNCSTSGLTTTFGYSPLGIAFHPRVFYLSPVILIYLPSLPRFSTSPAHASCGNLKLRTFCVNTTTVSTAVSFNHFCYFASAFTLCSAPQPLGTCRYLSLLNLLFPHFRGGRAACVRSLYCHIIPLGVIFLFYFAFILRRMGKNKAYARCEGF